MNSPTIDTRKVLNALVTIAMRFDRSEVNRFYDEKSKNANNPVVQSRINIFYHAMRKTCTWNTKLNNMKKI